MLRTNLALVLLAGALLFPTRHAWAEELLAKKGDVIDIAKDKGKRFKVRFAAGDDATVTLVLRGQGEAFPYVYLRLYDPKGKELANPKPLVLSNQKTLIITNAAEGEYTIELETYEHKGGTGTYSLHARRD